MNYTHISEVADQDESGFIVLTPQGMQDSLEHHWGSWNCSRTDGPLGPPCDTDRERYSTGVYRVGGGGVANQYISCFSREICS